MNNEYTFKGREEFEVVGLRIRMKSRTNIQDKVNPEDREVEKIVFQTSHGATISFNPAEWRTAEKEHEGYTVEESVKEQLAFKKLPKIIFEIAERIKTKKICVIETSYNECHFLDKDGSPKTTHFLKWEDLMQIEIKRSPKGDSDDLV